jgi:Ca-activated chloride channel homolog
VNNISISFVYPWLLFVVIPLVLLAIWPYFKLPVKYRKSRNRITSMVFHLIIIVLLTIVLSGMKVHNNYVSRKSDIIILIDQSASQMDNQDAINTFLNSVAEQLPDDYRIGIMEFGKDTIYSAQMSRNEAAALVNYRNNSMRADGSATNIEQALIFAQSQLDNIHNGRIILVSDGRQTDGNALIAAKSLANSGTRVDVKLIQPKHYQMDAQITRLVTPQKTQRGANTLMTVVIDSDTTGMAELNMSYTNDSGIIVHDTHAIMLTPGTLTYNFEHVFVDYGLNEIKVELDTLSTPDSIPQNNVYYGFVLITDEASQGILIIEGDLNDGQVLETIIKSDGYDVTRIGVDALPTSISELTLYQQVILVNVKNSDLTPSGFEALLNTYVRNYGGGLLTIGGNRAYQQLDMAADGVNRTFDQLLPVESNTDPKSMAVVIVLDASSSMISGGSNRFYMAKEGAKASVQALFDSRGDTTHMFGVVTFDANLKDVIEMTSVNNIDSIKQQIDSLVAGYGTQYIHGLQKAKDMLSDPIFNNSEKHIIFLTDGGSQDNQYPGVLDSLTDISVSAIALGNVGEHNLDPAKVEEIVRVYNNRGAYYRVTDASQLYNVMLTDTEQAQSGDFINEQTFTGVFTSLIPAFSSIGELQPLDGYYGTRVKPSANMIVKTETDDPLYVEWRPTSTSGKVGSFMSDLNGRADGFSYSFVQNFIGRAFILGMVKSIMPESNLSNNQSINVSYANQNHISSIRIRTLIEEGETLRASITSPNNETSRISLTTLSRTTFAGEFKRELPGIYTLEVIKYTSNGSVISIAYDYSTYSYSDEFINSYSLEQSIVLMEDIALSGGGQYFIDGDSLFTLEAETISETIDPAITLIIISLTLFLLDIIARKFKFKWPHELLRRQQIINYD